MRSEGRTDKADLKDARQECCEHASTLYKLGLPPDIATALSRTFPFDSNSNV